MAPNAEPDQVNNTRPPNGVKAARKPVRYHCNLNDKQKKHRQVTANITMHVLSIAVAPALGQEVGSCVNCNFEALNIARSLLFAWLPLPFSLLLHWDLPVTAIAISTAYLLLNHAHPYPQSRQRLF